MATIQYIMWDFDGTLAYRDGMWTDTLLSVLINSGITNIKTEEIRPFLNIGFTWHSPDTPHSELFCGKTWWEYYEEYFQEIYEKLGVNSIVANRLCKDVKMEYLNITKWHLYADSEKVLEETIQKNYKNIIISNHVPELTEIVKKLNISQYFYRIYSSGNIGYEKPNKKIYDYIIEDIQANRDDCIMIGDSYDADIAGAIRSNIKAILVRKENSKNYKWFCSNLENIHTTIELVQESNKKIT